MADNIRNQDNFTSAENYIINQLLRYNYNDATELDVLKLKIWVLDGEILDEEAGTVVDEDINNPVDHLRWLKHEVNNIDLYIRTQEGTLLENETPFSEDQRNKKNFMRSFVRSENPDTGEKFKDYESQYEARPTLIPDDIYTTMYSKFLEKRSSGEFTSFKDTLDLIPEFNLNTQASSDETIVDSWEPPATQKTNLDAQAVADKAREDSLYVTEMNDIRTEVTTMIDSLLPPTRSAPAWQSFTDYFTGDLVTESGIVYRATNNFTSSFPFNPVSGNWREQNAAWGLFTSYVKYDTVEYLGDQYLAVVDTIGETPNASSDWVFLEAGPAPFSSLYYQPSADLGTANFPRQRSQVEIADPSSSHRGIYVAALSDGGYRFRVRKVTDYLTPVTFSGTPTGITNSKYNLNELLMDDWRIVDKISVNGCIDLNITKDDLPTGGSATTLGSISRERYDELELRWNTINFFRENKLQGTGTRITLESMAQATIIDLEPEFDSIFDNRKQLKQSVTNILKEKYVEFM